MQSRQQAARQKEAVAFAAWAGGATAERPSQASSSASQLRRRGAREPAACYLPTKPDGRCLGGGGPVCRCRCRPAAALPRCLRPGFFRDSLSKAAEGKQAKGTHSLWIDPACFESAMNTYYLYESSTRRI
jgi:hypothetical protein